MVFLKVSKVFAKIFRNFLGSVSVLKARRFFSVFFQRISRCFQDFLEDC